MPRSETQEEFSKDDEPNRTYFGPDDPPEESVAPAVPKTALAVLVVMFVLLPLLLLGWLIASDGPEVERRPKKNTSTKRQRVDP